MTRSGTARPHSSLHELFDLFSNNFCELRSPVTESNRRPSPYHACKFRLITSDWGGLPQVGRIAVSERVALRLPLPEVVVAWFVTGPGDPPPRILDHLGSIRVDNRTVALASMVSLLSAPRPRASSCSEETHWSGVSIATRTITALR